MAGGRDFGETNLPRADIQSDLENVCSPHAMVGYSKSFDEHGGEDAVGSDFANSPVNRAVGIVQSDILDVDRSVPAWRPFTKGGVCI